MTHKDGYTFCNFCGSHESRVTFLVAGQRDTHICDCCAWDCAMLIYEKMKDRYNGEQTPLWKSPDTRIFPALRNSPKTNSPPWMMKMNNLTATTLAAHFPAVAPEIFRTLENEKPLTAATVKGPKGKKRNGVSAWPVTILDTPAQLPPLAARIDGLASQIARIIDGTVSMGVEMQLIILAFNLAAVAEQVAHMENNLEVPA